MNDGSRRKDNNTLKNIYAIYSFKRKMQKQKQAEKVELLGCPNKKIMKVIIREVADTCNKSVIREACGLQLD